MTLLGDSYCEYGSGLTSGQPTQSDGSNLQQAKLLAAVRRLHFKMNLPFLSLKTGKLVTCEKQALEPITTTAWDTHQESFAQTTVFTDDRWARPEPL